MPKFYGQNKKRIDPRYFLNETVDEGVFGSMRRALMGRNEEEEAQFTAARENLEKSALAYIDQFQGAEVGPFLKKGAPFGQSKVPFESDSSWKEEMNMGASQGKRFPEEIEKSIIEQGKILNNILKTFATEAGNIDTDSDSQSNMPLSAVQVREAAVWPSLFARNLKGA